MERMSPTLVVEALAPLNGRHTSITWMEHPFSVTGDNHTDHGGRGEGPDGFDLLTAALGQCLLSTLLARAQHDGIEIRSAKAVVSAKSRMRGTRVAPYLSDFEVDLHIQGDIDEETRVDLERATQKMCGVRETLLQMPRIEERVHVVAAE